MSTGQWTVPVLCDWEGNRRFGFTDWVYQPMDRWLQKACGDEHPAVEVWHPFSFTTKS